MLKGEGAIILPCETPLTVYLMHWPSSRPSVVFTLHNFIVDCWTEIISEKSSHRNQCIN